MPGMSHELASLGPAIIALNELCFDGFSHSTAPVAERVACTTGRPGSSSSRPWPAGCHVSTPWSSSTGSAATCAASSAARVAAASRARRVVHHALGRVGVLEQLVVGVRLDLAVAVDHHRLDLAPALLDLLLERVRLALGARELLHAVARLLLRLLLGAQQLGARVVGRGLRSLLGLLARDELVDLGLHVLEVVLGHLVGAWRSSTRSSTG